MHWYSDELFREIADFIRNYLVKTKSSTAKNERQLKSGLHYNTNIVFTVTLIHKMDKHSGVYLFINVFINFTLSASYLLS